MLFDGQPSGYVNLNGSQIVTAVPLAVAGQTTTLLEVEIQGSRISGLSLPVVAALPGILSIANADGTANAASNPAGADSIVTVSLTGDGGADPSTISAVVGGLPATVVAAPPADNTGVRMLMIQLPDGVNSGDPVVISVGASSSSGVPVW